MRFKILGLRFDVWDDNTFVDERHELFDELEAFDPRWQQHYRTTREAVLAAGPRAIELFKDWCKGPGKGCASCQQIPDTLEAVERMQQALSRLLRSSRCQSIGPQKPIR